MLRNKNISIFKERVYTISLILLATLILTGCSKQKDPLPKEILSLALDKKLVGKDARDFLSRMHSGDVSSDTNEIGFYSGAQGGATIYVSFFEDKKIAQAEEKRMTDKISRGNSAFTNGDVFYFDGLKIYKCFGYSQSHFIFSKEANLYWLTADSDIDRRFLSDYLDYLNK